MIQKTCFVWFSPFGLFLIFLRRFQLSKKLASSHSQISVPRSRSLKPKYLLTSSGWVASYLLLFWCFGEKKMPKKCVVTHFTSVSSLEKGTSLHTNPFLTMTHPKRRNVASAGLTSFRAIVKIGVLPSIISEKLRVFIDSRLELSKSLTPMTS